MIKQDRIRWVCHAQSKVGDREQERLLKYSTIALIHYHLFIYDSTKLQEGKEDKEDRENGG